MLWWIANAVALLLVIPLVIVLANRIIAEAIAANRYSGDILRHGVGIAGNLDPVPALGQTAQLSAQVRTHAEAYVTALRQRL